MIKKYNCEININVQEKFACLKLDNIKYGCTNGYNKSGMYKKRYSLCSDTFALFKNSVSKALYTHITYTQIVCPHFYGMWNNM